MMSSVGEVVNLDNPVHVTDEVEVWLGDLAREMRDSLIRLLNNTLKSSQLDIANIPSQICCISEMVNFSENAK